MRKALVILGLLGFLIQPASAQYLNATPTGAAANVYPIAQPVAQSCGTGVVGATMEPVKIQKRHWWQFSRTGYRAVNSGSTGYAAPVQTQCGCPTPLGSNLEPVLVPKRRFWESDRVELMQLNTPKTGAAAPIYLCPVPTGGATVIERPAEPIPPQKVEKPKPKPKHKTKSKSVRGYW